MIEHRPAAQRAVLHLSPNFFADDFFVACSEIRFKGNFAELAFRGGKGGVDLECALSGSAPAFGCFFKLCKGLLALFNRGKIKINVRVLPVVALIVQNIGKARHIGKLHFCPPDAAAVVPVGVNKGNCVPLYGGHGQRMAVVAVAYDVSDAQL